MALTISGQTQFAGLGLGGAPQGIVQDWDDLNTFYFLVTGTTWKVYKFIWPDTLIEVADFGARSGSFSRAALERNFKYGGGYVDMTWHYCVHLYLLGSNTQGTLI